MTLGLRYAARSDRGLVRSNNEDSVYAGARLLALADGMGGHAAGEVASQLVIAALAHLDDDEPGGDLLAKLDEAVHQGNSAIAAHVEAEPELEGMGTTLTAILFAGTRLGLVHIGDSRSYLLRDGELSQITKDDTFVQTLVDEGRITAEEAHSHPQRSLIMRALTGHEVEPTLTVREARVGDRYLLCSDGLSDPVSHETIKEALQIEDVAESADRLIELALRGGGPDNVTVVVADVVDNDYGQTQPILAGAVSGSDDDAAPPNTAAGRASAINPKRTQAKRVVPEPEIPTRPRRSRRRMLIAAAVVVLLVAAGLWGVKKYIDNNFYVIDHAGTVTIMQGIQSSVLGVSLSEPFLYACLRSDNAVAHVAYGEQRADCKPMQLQDLRQSERTQVQAGLPGGSLDDAIRQLRDLADTSLLPICKPAATPTPTPSTTPTTKAPVPGTSGRPPVTGQQNPDADDPDADNPTAPTNRNPDSPTTTRPPAPTTSAAPTPQQEPGVDCREAA